MSFIKKKFEQIRPLFEKGGKYEKFYEVFEAHETLFLQPKEVTKPKGTQIRDAVDLKRVMTTVIIALIPCLIFGIWNVGEQHAIATGQALATADKFIFGAIRFVPILAVSYAVGLGIEFVFSSLRKHPVSEGFLVSGMLIPLVLPATTPLWQVGVATAIAVVLGKEVFGGTGFNILNPALTARAVMFFAYPGSMTGSQGLWVDLAGEKTSDAFTGATVLDLASSGKPLVSLAGEPLSFMDMFMGWIPGSIGETSALMCLIGAAILVITGIGSLRIMLSMVAGGLFMGYVFNFFGSAYFADPCMHIVAGGFAFGTVFMATDPVSAAQTGTGKIIYGFLAGLLSILIRVTNPAFPEGVMLGILLANVLAPFIDYYVVQSNKNRRLKRATV